MKSIVAYSTYSKKKKKKLAALIRTGCPAGVGGEGSERC